MVRKRHATRSPMQGTKQAFFIMRVCVQLSSESEQIGLHPRYFTSHRIASHHTRHHIASFNITSTSKSHHITSPYITSHHITSHHICRSFCTFIQRYEPSVRERRAAPCCCTCTLASNASSSPFHITSASASHHLTSHLPVALHIHRALGTFSHPQCVRDERHPAGAPVSWLATPPPLENF